jgi:hypothetical protein
MNTLHRRASSKSSGASRKDLPGRIAGIGMRRTAVKALLIVYTSEAASAMLVHPSAGRNQIRCWGVDGVEAAGVLPCAESVETGC